MWQVIQLGPLTFHLYGLVLGLAIVTAWTITQRLLQRKGFDEKSFDRVGWLTVAAGVVGARLYHVIDYWAYYRLYPEQIPAVWHGGLGIWGAVAGGAVGLSIALGKQRHWWWPMVDAIAAALPLAQAIGRWGNFFNYELFGKPTTAPWGLFVPVQFRPAGFETFTHYHPLFLYESLLNMGLFGLLQLVLIKQQGSLGTGKVLGGYLIGYGLIRFFLETWRLRVWTVGGLPTAQWFGIAAVTIGILLLTRVGWKHETATSG